MKAESISRTITNHVYTVAYYNGETESVENKSITSNQDLENSDFKKLFKGTSNTFLKVIKDETTTSKYTMSIQDFVKYANKE